MRSYHIEIIHARGSTTYLEDRTIRADSMEIKSSGCYVFYVKESPIAYYPIINTIITKLEKE
jgi:hypothetical protein